MSSENQVRRAHKLLDDIAKGYSASVGEVNNLRNLLPERPKDATLVDLLDRVNSAWMLSGRNEWGFDTPKEHFDWLLKLRNDLFRIIKNEAAAVLNEVDPGLSAFIGPEPGKPAHPEFLETEADYAEAPEGTIVACDDSPPWHKFNSEWLSTITYGYQSVKIMSGVRRQILRWGWGE